MNPIGGYFELELNKGEEFHKNAIRLNTGRNAFEYILRAKGYKKVYLPYYTCDVMLEPIRKLNIDCQFYNIDRQFRPIFDFSNIENNDVFVYTNYFGLCDNITKEVSLLCKNLIVDNSQAFYSMPLPQVDTFYSARKFFGVPDGAYLYTDKLLHNNFETDFSYQRFQHLLGRIDVGAEDFYSEFKKNDEALINQPIKLMSKLTQHLLSGINYEAIAKIRIDNFQYLHSKLKKSNNLNIELINKNVPTVYPYLTINGIELKRKLIKNKVFVVTYWPNESICYDHNTIEFNLLNDLLPLPIDQRYNEEVLKKIIELI